MYRTTGGTGLATLISMEILTTLAQIPLMFMGGFVIILAIAVVWALARARPDAPTGNRDAPYLFRSRRISRLAFKPDNPDTP